MNCLKKKILTVIGTIEFTLGFVTILALLIMGGYHIAMWKELTPWIIIDLLVMVHGSKLVCKNERMGGND